MLPDIVTVTKLVLTVKHIIVISVSYRDTTTTTTHRFIIANSRSSTHDVTTSITKKSPHIDVTRGNRSADIVIRYSMLPNPLSIAPAQIANGTATVDRWLINY